MRDTNVLIHYKRKLVMREKLNVTIRDRRKPKMREMPHTQKTKNGRKLTL